MIASAKRQNLVDSLSSEWKPHELRDLAATLLQLADSADDGGDDSSSRSVFRWPAARARIESNAVNLAVKARLIIEHRERRRRYVSTDVLGEPAWDMLLDLFIKFTRGAKVTTSSLCITSRVPLTTALRHISVLEEKGYVTRGQSRLDKQATLVGLSDAGVLAIGQYLEGF